MPPTVQEQRFSPHRTLHLCAEAQDVVFTSPPQNAVEDRLRPPASRFMQYLEYGFPRRHLLGFSVNRSTGSPLINSAASNYDGLVFVIVLGRFA